MRADFVVEACGLSLGFRWDGPGLSQVVEEVLLPNWERTAGPAQFLFGLRRHSDGEIEISRNGERLARATDRVSASHKLQQLVQQELATRAGHFVFVHAGVVLWEDSLVVLPGASRAGKSTLVKAMVDAGARYFSDEFAVLDGEGRVHAYPRSLWMRVGHSRRVATPARCLGWGPELTPRRAEGFLFATFRQGARWQPRPLTSATAILELLRHAPAVREQPQRILRLLARGVQAATCVQSERGETDEVIRWLREPGGLAAARSTVLPSAGALQR